VAALHAGNHRRAPAMTICGGGEEVNVGRQNQGTKEMRRGTER
jgi:hypothetical protein